MASVQIRYTSEHHSTKDISDRISTRLADMGHQVDELDLLAAADVRPEAGHALAIGSAVHNGAWLPSADTFVKDNARYLRALPVWMFSVGMTDALPGPLRLLASRAEQPGIARLLDLVRPRGYRRFSGVIRPEHLDRRSTAFFRLLGCRYGDYRTGQESMPGQPASTGIWRAGPTGRSTFLRRKRSTFLCPSERPGCPPQADA